VGSAGRGCSDLAGAGAAERLTDAAASAFTEAFGIGLLIASAVALATAVLVARFMPAHHLRLAATQPRTITTGHGACWAH